MAFNWRKFPWTNLHDLNLDWIIQTVKTLENNLADAVSTFPKMIDTAISNTLTGSGDLTINKTGDVRISGNSVQLSRTLISDSAEQLHLINPNSNTDMIANYNNGVLTLTNNQELAKGVAVYPINTPADGGGDNSDFAANVGYVKTAVEAVSTALATETENRTSGDAALQSAVGAVRTALSTETENRKAGDAAIQTAIEHEIKPKLVRDFHVAGTASQDGYITAVTFKDGYPKSVLDNLIAQGANIRLVVDHDAMSDYFNLCYSTESSYRGFSGILLVTQDNTAAAMVIVYNGTDFTVHSNNAT